MKIGDVSIQNTFSIGQAVFNLNDQGLILLQGENLDDTSANSNGAGKSSLLNAIYWCLWGRTPPAVNGTSLSGDAVIRKGEKRAAVLVEVIDGDERWHITRDRIKGKELVELYHIDDKGNVETHTQGTIKLNQAFIEKILGSSEEVFRAALFIGQEALVDLPALTDKALKEIVEEAAGVTSLEEAYSIAKDKHSTARSVVTKIELALEKLKFARDNLNDIRELAKGRATNFESERANTITDLNSTIAGDTMKRNSLLSLFTAPATVDAYEFAKAERAEIAKTVSEYSKNVKEIHTAEQSLRALEKEQARVTGELRTAVSKAADAKKEMDTLAAAVAGQSECPECGSIMEDEHLANSRASARARHDAAIIAARGLRGVWEANKAAIAESEETLAKRKAALSDVSELTARDAEMAKIVSEYEDIKRQIDIIADNIADNTDKIAKESRKTNPYDAEIEKLSADIVDHDKQISTLNEDQKKAQSELDDLASVVSLFSPKGVRAEVLDEVTPYLNDRTAIYLATLSDGNITATWNTLQTNAKGDIKERFSIEVAKAGSGDSFAAVSGGEKRKVRLACALALQDLVATRATKPFHLWVGDEIDQALDAAGLERLMMVLQEKTKDRGTVVVISHSDLRDWIDNVWTMRLKDKQSELVV